MAKRLAEHLTSRYWEASQRLISRRARRKVIVYVEGYDDVPFWRALLAELETDDYAFEVMLPSRTSLGKGKKTALTNVLAPQLGAYMLACVDADYDYLMQDACEGSRLLCRSPYVFHTYAYAIENYQCYAPTLRTVQALATLNDREVIAYADFLALFSLTVYPLFVFSVWCYRHRLSSAFSLADFCEVFRIDGVNVFHPEKTLEKLRHRVNGKLALLQRKLPQARQTYRMLDEELRQLGVTPETTYLFLRGHDLFDHVILPLLEAVCDSLRREREREICALAEHDTQRQNELASYQHSSSSPAEMLRKHTGYRSCPLYRRIQADISQFLAKRLAVQGDTIPYQKTESSSQNT